MSSRRVLRRLRDQRYRVTLPAARLLQRQVVDTVAPTTEWLERAVGEQSPTVSVVMATHNRARLLPRAIDSVLAQRHRRWELVVVDDGSEDDTPRVLASYGDDRIRTLRTDCRGPAGARNAALALCTGDAVAYLDDDNLMHPLWLHAVAWAFSTFPDESCLYGARIVEANTCAMPGLPTSRMPRYQFVPYRRWLLEQANFIDVNVLAHRHPMAEARFTESLAQAADWELVLRLTRDSDPLALPVVASLYSTSGGQRLSDDPTAGREASLVAGLARRARRG